MMIGKYSGLEEKKKILIDKYQSLLVTKKEAARELRISSATIDRMRRNGEISSNRIGGQIMFRIDEILKLIEG